MEEIQQFIIRNKSRYFHIKDGSGNRVAYVEDQDPNTLAESFAVEYAELDEGKYTIGVWKNANGMKSILTKNFKVGEMSLLTANGFTPNAKTMKGNSLQEIIEHAKAEARREALLEMKVEKIQDFINDEIKPFLKAWKELAELDIKALREGIEALKNDDEDDDEDAIEKLEKFQKGFSIVRSMAKAS